MPLTPDWHTAPGADGLVDLYCPGGEPADDDPDDLGIARRPGPDGHPNGVHVDFRPQHYPTYAKAADGIWAGACCCGQWSDPAAIRRAGLNAAWTAHAMQLPPGAPFAADGAPH